MGTLASPSSFHTRRGGSGAERSGDACVALPFIPMGTLASPSPFHTRRGGGGAQWSGDACVALVSIPRAPLLSKNTRCLMLLRNPGSRKLANQAIELQRLLILR